MKYILLLTLVFSNLVFLLQASPEGAPYQDIWDLADHPKNESLRDKFFSGGFEVKRTKSEGTRASYEAVYALLFDPEYEEFRKKLKEGHREIKSEGTMLSYQDIWNLADHPKKKPFRDKFFNGGFEVKKTKSEDKLEEGHREDKNTGRGTKCSRQFK